MQNGPEIYLNNIKAKTVTVTNNHTHTTQIVYDDIRLPFPTLADPLVAGEQPVLVCRQASLDLLDGWLAAACAGEARADAHRLVVVSGAEGTGKQDLLRTWLARLRSRPTPPLIADVPFLPPWIDPGEQGDFYRTHPGWQLDWAQYGDEIQALFPHHFQLGSYPWVLLGAQLAHQCEAVRGLLAQAAATPGRGGLRVEPAAEEMRRTLLMLLHAALRQGPLVLTLEHVQDADLAWLMWLKLWLADLAARPLLFVVTVDTPFKLDDERLAALGGVWLPWLREQTAPHSPRSHWLALGRLTRGEIEELLAPSAHIWAGDLRYLSEGMPAVLRELLAYWRDEGQAEQGADGRWRLHFDLQRTAPGSLALRLVEEPLAACAARAQALGYDLSADDLRGWLQLAAWEGDIFSDEALARALDLYDEEQYEPFQIVLDEALCRDEEGVGLIEELDEVVELPTAQLDHPVRTLARYRISPPVLGRILHVLQSERDQQAGGQCYAQALAAAYTPAVERVAPRLVEIYEAVGDPAAAQAVRARWFVPNPVDASVWDALQALAAGPDDKRLLLRHIAEDYRQTHLRRHPGDFLVSLRLAQTLAQELKNVGSSGRILYYLGSVYSDLGDQQQALVYLEQALPLSRQVGDKGGEAVTLTNIGLVYSNLGDKQQALAYYEQSLPLRRQVGDRFGEVVTRYNIAMVSEALGDLARAVAELEMVVALDEAIHRPDLDADRAALKQVRAVLSAQGEV